VCSHFAANIDKVSKRNNDYKITKKKLKFAYNSDIYYHDIDVHDIVFWFGDLNYRIDSISLNKVLELINLNDLNELTKNDQLIREKNTLKIFENFQEGTINFKPTYKYLVQTDTFFTRSEKLDQDCENIGYTDRILWRTTEKLKVFIFRIKRL